MCGIAGVLRFDGMPADPTRLRAMAGTLSHRGPDAEGFHRDGPLGLAHRRLSILDLEGGNQPMTAPDGPAVIVFNGEIYNYVELGDGLRRRGHCFATRSDTEVILHLYEEKGPDCVGDLRGMFAFALWDPRRRRLVLARDRVGIKPLFYVHDDRMVAFASEIKALLTLPEVARDLDTVALSDYLSCGYVPAPRTAFRAIRKLPAAHLMIIEEGRLSARRYWSLPAAGEDRTEADWTEELDATLREAVRLHMRSDVPVGALLSGGLDSSLVVALASGAASGPIRTFSVGFPDDTGLSELPYARAVARRYGTEHTEFILEPHGVEVVPSLLAHFDEPFADPSAIPCSHIAGTAARHVKVCLSGDGGDEAFAGYDAYRLARRLGRYDWIPLGLRRALLGPLERRWPEYVRGKGLLRFLTLPPDDRYAEIMGTIDLAARDWLLSPGFREAAADHHPYSRFRDLYLTLPARDEVERLQRLDVETYLPDDILVKSDITSMLHSLELRVPLLDHKVLELAFRMPTVLKLRGRQSKAILRRAFADEFPAEVRHRGKQGFGIPLDAWLRGDLRGFAREILTDPVTRRRGILDSGGVERLLRSQARGRRDLSNEIWSALALEIWFRERVDRAVALAASTA